MQYLFLLFPMLLFCWFPCPAQKVMQIEKFGSPKTTKIYLGEEIDYRLRGDDVWHYGYIEDLLIDRNVIVLGDRYVNLGDIEAFRYEHGWARPMSTSLFWFGIGWSGFAAIGTATDGDATTNYRWSDAAVTGTSVALAFLIPRIFRYRKIRFGKKKRLRMLDISFD